MRLRESFGLAAIFAALVVLLSNPLGAQSVVTGGIAGTITDSTGGVIVGARVTLSNPATGSTQTVTSSSTGTYNLSLLKPGHYSLSVGKDGFSTAALGVDVILGQIVSANVKLEPGSVSTTVEVSAAGPVLQTENANITTNFDTEQLNEIPNPGGDITYLANTAPGITSNNSTMGGYGNFSAFGLPADANLFTVNGNDYNDPFLNLNNTGASNLLLGGNEMQEVAIVANGYTGQYGRQAGAQLDYSTKSGSNTLHGDAVYFWTGRALTANDPINKLGERAAGEPNTRPFENNNQWAAALGGPIKKDKAFFFVNTEGIRYIFGSVHAVTLMTPAFQDYVASNIPADAATQTFYSNVFKLYNAAPGISKAAPNLASSTDPTNPAYLGSCVNYAVNAAGQIFDPVSGAILPAALQATGATPGGCTESYTQSVSNGNREWILSGRVDYNLSDSDKIFGRVKFDRGVQPTYTDSVNPVFNDNSVQPQNEGQLNYTHVFSQNVVNNFIGSVLYYSAIFGNSNPAAALALFPGNLAFNVDGSSVTALGTGSGNPGGFAGGLLFPQGRDVTQWQLIDDLAITRGSHAFKMGINFRRDDVSDYSSEILTPYPVIQTSLLGFANDQIFVPGVGGSVIHNFSNSKDQPIAFYSFGLYFQDEWRTNPKLKFTLTLRADRNSGGACQHACATLPVTPFNDMPHGADIPYNAAYGGSFRTGVRNILPDVEKVVFEPRFGFAWTPLGENTVFRGGVGLFTDLYPGIILGLYTTNFPQFNPWNVAAGSLAFDLNPASATAFPSSGVNVIQQCNGAFTTNFNTPGGNLNTYSALASGIPGGCVSSSTGNLIVPAFADTDGKLLNPKYLEWNFEVQHSFARNVMLSVNYVGNHGYDELIQNPFLNSYCDPVNCAGSGFTDSGLPSAAPDPRVANVQQMTNAGYSNYDGVTFSLQEAGWHGLSGRLNYTYSHSLDVLSNGGINPFSFINSILFQLNPYNPSASYSSSDNDVRHNISANYIYALPFKTENHALNYAVGGWQLSGSFFWHTGFPFSILDGATLAKFQTDNLSLATILAQPNFATRNFSNAAPCAAGLVNGTACFGPAGATNTANTILPSTNFTGSVVGRNAFEGPGFFGADFSLRKTFDLTERLKFQLGFNAYNVFNHLNYGTPSPNSNGSAGAFGNTVFTATMPTSPYGAFAAAATDQRICQIQGKFTF
jgi:hypothetical protein